MADKERSLGISEITPENLNPQKFIMEKVAEIRSRVGEDLAINTLSGGVDSSTVTLLGHLALNERLKTYFIDNGLMRVDESDYVVSLFQSLGIKVQLIDAQKAFFNALKGIKDPEEKREAITKTFYHNVFGPLIRENHARYLLQGTNLTDIEETVAGIKRQHNVLEQLGIDPQERYGYQIIEPLVQLRKEAVRILAKTLGLPEKVYNRPPFPGPALATRVIGEVTPARIATVRAATKVVEEELGETGAFQYMAILHENPITGLRNGKRDFGQQIEVRCWDSRDARVGTPTEIPYPTLFKLAERITTEVPGVVSVTYNITSKPPSTIEAV